MKLTTLHFASDIIPDRYIPLHNIYSCILKYVLFLMLQRILEGKRDKLAEQLAEATQLKSSIDRRSASVSALLSKCLDQDAASDFEHFVHMKASLQVESRELADRVKLGEEQLSALKETLKS
jgi:hypothetical protein